jgi:hypothetical protein
MEALFGSNLFNVILFLSGVASIVSLFVGIWRYRKTALALNAALTLALSALAAYSFFRYQALRNAESALLRRKEAAHADARDLLSSLSTVDASDEGRARGVAVAGLAYLEQYRDLYPATFDLAQKTIRVDIELAQRETNNIEERRHLIQAGQTMLAALQGLAGGSPPDR